jgi:hypothetical protein
VMYAGHCRQVSNRDRCKRALTLALAIGLSASAACDGSPTVRPFIVGTAPNAQDWSQFFVERQLDLQMPKSGPPLIRIGKIAVGNDGQLFVPEGRGRRILVFASDGHLDREIQGGPKGSFKLEMLGAMALDQDGNVFISDPSSNWVTVLGPPLFETIRRFQLKTPIADMIVLQDSSIVTYFPDDAEGVFRHFDPKGNLLGVSQKVNDARLRIFSGRIQNGGIVKDSSGGLFGMEPSKYRLIHFARNFEVREVLRGGLDTLWSPDSRPFPSRLNPKGYGPEHERWWDSFMHIGRPFAPARGILLVSIFASDGMSIAEEFANVYRMDGRVLAQGLRVPHNGHIVGAGGGRVYVVRNAHLVGDSSMAPLQLYEYTWKGTDAATIAARHGDQ